MVTVTTRFVHFSILAVSTLALDFGVMKTPRIVGGRVSDIGEFPFYVEIGGCGGSLVAPDIVLTAAHCGDLTDSQFSVGAFKSMTLSHGAQARFCDVWIPDPRYDPVAVEFDFALCKLDRPVEIDSSFTIELNEDDSLPRDREDLVVMGLGALFFEGPAADTLQDVTVPYITNEKCNKANAYNGAVTDAMFCAGFPAKGGKDACQGDSGGPIVKLTEKIDGSIVVTQMGVVSWGEDCAKKNKPGIYARISTRIDWIKNTMCDELRSVASFCGNPIPTSVQNECDGVELKVTLTTDEFPRETSWILQSAEDNDKVKARKYLIKSHKNVDKVCLKSDHCYTWTLQDAYGDGMCAEDYDCGSYKLALNNNKISSGVGDFSKKKKKSFCTEAQNPKSNLVPTLEPTLEPTSEPTSSTSTTSTSHTSFSDNLEPSDDELTCNIASKINCTVVGPGDLAGSSCDVLGGLHHTTCPADHTVFFAYLEYDGSFGSSVYVTATCSENESDYQKEKVLQKGDFFFFLVMCDEMTFAIQGNDPETDADFVTGSTIETACPGPWTIGNEIAPGLKLAHYASFNENDTFLNIQEAEIQIDYIAIDTADNPGNNPVTIAAAQISASLPFKTGSLNSPFVFKEQQRIIHTETHKLDLTSQSDQTMQFSLSLSVKNANKCKPSSTLELQL